MNIIKNEVIQTNHGRNKYKLIKHKTFNIY
jgi:hypothetical protein